MSNKRQLSLNMATNYVSSLLGVVLGFLIPPLALSYWGADRYGIWTLITSFIAYLSTSGFGIETASAVLMAKAGTSAGKNQIFRSALLLLTVSSLFFCILLVGFGCLLPEWIGIFGRIPADLIDDSRMAILIFVLSFFINYPFSVVSSGLIGYQRQYFDNLFRMLIPLSSLGSLLFVMTLHGNLTTFALVQATIALFLSFLKLILYWFFVRNRGDDERLSGPPIPNEPDPGVIVIVRSGIRYFLYGFSVLIIMNIDNFLISNYVGVSSVTAFSLTTKIFLMTNTFVTLFVASLAPVISREFGKGNYPWLIDAYRDLTKLALFLGGAICVGGVLFLEDFIVHLWVGEAGSAGFSVIISVAVYCFLSIVTNVSNIFLIQSNLTRGLIALGWLEAGLHLGLVVLLIPTLGVLGVAIGQVVATGLSQSWRSPYLVLRNTGGRLVFDWKLFGTFSFFLLLPVLLTGAAITVFIEGIFLRSFCSLILFAFFILGCYRFFIGSQPLREFPAMLRARFSRL